MFREINEVKREERLRREAQKQIEWLNGVGSIKPEHKMTLEECRNFWNDVFNNLKNEES